MAERAKGKKQRRSKSKKANGVGSNVVQFPHGGIPDEVRQRHLDAISKAELAVERARKPLKAAQTKLTAARKLAEEDGVNVDALGDARKLVKRDRIDVLQRYVETGHFLRLLDSPLSTQLDLFRTVDMPAPVSINLQGYAAGKAGNAFDNPHPPGTEQYIQYKAGYDTGQQELQEQLRRAND